MRILTVDDEKLICLVLKRSIEKRLDYTVDFAYTGSEAMEKIIEHDYDVIITDLNMPGIHGLDLLRKIREMGMTTPVIIISAFLNMSALDSISQYGVFRCISKPFQIDDVIAAIMEIANETWPAEQTSFE